jgi:ferredoxin
MKLSIDEKKCTSCGYCVLACPQEALTNIVGLEINEEECNGCGECVAYCHAQALEVTYAK